MSEYKKLEAHDACPGGLSQNIRECGCADILPRLNEIEHAWEGKQRRAALSQMSALVEEQGIRPCTATLKARYQFETGDPQGAIETIQQLIELKPELGPPLALLSEFLAAVDDDRALEVLLDAAEKYELESGNVAFLISAILQNAVKMAQIRDALGAIAWLRIAYEFLDENGQAEVAQLMIGDYLSKNCAIFANLSLAPLVTPPGEQAPPELKPFGEALQASHRGRFRQAVGRLQEAVKQAPDRFDAWKELAVCQAAAGLRAEAVATLREMANQQGLSDAWRLWIDSVAQWYDAAVVQPAVYRQELRWEVDDANAVLELLHSDPKALVLPNLREIARDMMPPPKAAFAILTQPHLQTATADEASEIDPARVPALLGIALLFGKQTDQPASIQIVVDPKDVDAVAAQLEAVLQGHLKQRTTASASRTIPACLRHDVRWELSGVESGDIPTIVEKCDQYWLEQVWANMPHVSLKGKTPREAATDSQLARDLAAAVFNIECVMVSIGKTADFDALRKSLNVPTVPVVDPWETPIDQIPLPQWTRVDTLKLGQDDAMKLFSLAVGLRYVGVVRLAGNALLEMLGPEDAKLKAGILHQMSEAEHDLKRSAADLQQAAELLEQANEESFPYRYLSLERTLQAGDSGNLESRMRSAFNATSSQPQYVQALMQLLAQFGFSMQPGGAQTAAQTPPAGGGLWTPDGGAPAEPAAEEKKESKLWIPGMD